jgi:transketolase
MHDQEHIRALTRQIRYWILASTTRAGSGHASSSLSAVELTTALLFGGFFRADPHNPAHPNNDRLIFSKGHAAPLLYSLYAAAGMVSEEELLSLRTFGSRLEGHPTPVFPYAEAATGSLGQGLSIGLGMALNGKYLDNLPYRTFVLLGDSEMAEGSQWEALQLAAHYELGNLVGILDVNRLGQRGQTMYGHDLEAYSRRVSAFGWDTFLVDGHSLDEIEHAYRKALVPGRTRPVMIIARTLKGKGVSLIEDMEGWHGKPLPEDDFERAVADLGDVDKSLVGKMAHPEDLRPAQDGPKTSDAPVYSPGEQVSTREAYGSALAGMHADYPNMVVLDGEVSNSTHAASFAKSYPDRFFEMFIAEQNMAGAALGLSLRGKKPFVSSFAAFMTRAFDQIRMSRYSEPNMVFAGSHAGISIGEDGASQMGLEDLAMFRSVLDSVVFHPCDAQSTDKVVREAAELEGITYIRTLRGKTPVLYEQEESFPPGGSKVLRESGDDAYTVCAAGMTVHEALAAYGELLAQGIAIRVVDCYCIKPLDRETLLRSGKTGGVLTVEDHYPQGGLGEAVCSELSDTATPVHSLAVDRLPRTGKPQELMDYAGISAKAIAEKIRSLLAQGENAL